MRIAAVLLMGAALTGCVGEKTMLVNDEGQVTHCDGWGFGLIGMPMALASHADCMKKAHEAGYSEVGQPAQTAVVLPAQVQPAIAAATQNP